MSRNCHECHTPIPAGQAVIRSQSFERVSFHRECWEQHQLLPTQRRAVELVAV